MKLVSISESPKANKKLVAVFESDTGRRKSVHFGAAGMTDYTLGASKQQREQYRTRHAKDLLTLDPTRAGFLSYGILWGRSRSREKNIAEYKDTFDL
jgi:hypothetical protein